jgi:hypothetical protein
MKLFTGYTQNDLARLCAAPATIGRSFATLLVSTACSGACLIAVSFLLPAPTADSETSFSLFAEVFLFSYAQVYYWVGSLAYALVLSLKLGQAGQRSDRLFLRKIFAIVSGHSVWLNAPVTACLYAVLFGSTAGLLAAVLFFYVFLFFYFRAVGLSLHAAFDREARQMKHTAILTGLAVYLIGMLPLFLPVLLLWVVARLLLCVLPFRDAQG